MNITMIVPYFKPEVTAIVHLMDDLSRDLGKYGANVTVITGYPLRGTSQEIRKEYLNKPEEQIEDNVRVLRAGSKHEEGKHFFIRGLKFILKTRAFYRAACRLSSDIYFIYSTPPVMGVIGAKLSKMAPTVYCLQDIFPDNLTAQGKLKHNGIIYKILRVMEDYIYRTNTHIVTISKEMKENLVEKKVDENRISVIGNWIDTDEIKYIPRDKNHLFDRFALNRSIFYVSYSGNLGYAQDLDIILESAKQTQLIEPEIKYIIIGSGVCESKIKKKIVEEGIKNVMMFPLQPEEDAAYVYSLGDVGLVTLKQNLHEYAMPSKTWSMMSASQPIICTAELNTQLYEMIDGTKAGVVIRPGDSQGLARQIIDLYHNRNRLKAYGVNGRAYAEMNLTRESATIKYYILLEKLAGGGKGFV